MYQTEKESAVCACAAAAEEAEDGDRSSDDDEDSRKAVEEDEQTRRRNVLEQFDVEECLALDVHPTTETKNCTTTDLRRKRRRSWSTE